MHDLSSNCQKCDGIFDLYPGFNQELRIWLKGLQKEHPELHISAAGRGKMEQEMLFYRAATRAHYGESAHNYNAAIDVFFLIDGKYSLDQTMFYCIIIPNLYASFLWYGAPHVLYYERPHIELKNWKELVSDGTLKLVE